MKVPKIPNIGCNFPPELRTFATDVKEGFKSLWDQLNSGTYSAKVDQIYLGPTSPGYIEWNPGSALPIWNPGDGGGGWPLTGVKWQQVVVVAKTGGDYATIQGAIDSIFDAGLSNQYVILICPGIYLENIIVPAFINLVGIQPGSTHRGHTSAGHSVMVRADTGTAVCILTGGNTKLANIRFFTLGASTHALFCSVSSGSVFATNCSFEQGGANPTAYAVNDLMDNTNGYGGYFNCYFGSSQKALVRQGRGYTTLTNCVFSRFAASTVPLTTVSISGIPSTIYSMNNDYGSGTTSMDIDTNCTVESQNDVVQGVTGAGTFNFNSPWFSDVKLLDTNASNVLSLIWNENDISNRTLNFLVGGADRFITLSGNPTLADWFDQSVKVVSAPTFADINLSGLSGNIISSDSVETSIEELDARLYNQQATTTEPTGFVNRTDSTIAFNTGNLTFTLDDAGSSYDYYCRGVKNTNSIAKTTVIGDTTGLHFIYLDSNNDLQNTTALWAYDNSLVFVGLVYWRAGGNDALVMDERHGLTMDIATHGYLHYTINTRYESGLGGTFNDDNTFSIASGVYADEDLAFSVGAQTTCRVLYGDGSNQWNFDTAGVGYYKETAGVIQYDDGDGTPADVTNGQHVAYWIFATNDKDNPIWSVMGTRIDANLVNAIQNNTLSTINLTNLPSEELLLLYRVILKRTGTSESVADVSDYRGTANPPIGNYVASDHGALEGLDDDDHAQYLRADGTRVLAGAWDMGSQVLTNVNIDTGNIHNDVVNTEWDAAYTHIGESGASHTYIDQSVVSGANVIFGTLGCGAITSSGASIFNSGSVDVDFTVNWNTGIGLFVEGSSGRVGIGTTTPGYILDIDAGEIENGYYNGLRIIDTGWKATSHPMLEFYNSNELFNGSLARIYGEIGDSGTNSKLYFAVADSSKSLQDRMVIDKGGNVGIGLTTVDDNYKLIVRRAANVNFGIGLQSSELAIIAFNDALSANVPMRFYASEFNLLNGYVGIGVADPDTKVEIFNAGNQLKLSFDGTDSAVFAVDTDGVLTITPSGAAINFANKNLTSVGAIGCNEITIADGASLNLQEDITFGGATTENLLLVPDNLADALSLKNANGDVFLKTVSTTGSLGVEFPQVTTLADRSLMASIAAPIADAEIANKKYVDDTAGGGGGATTALDNLAAVAINESLISDTDNTDDLGSAAKEWKDLYIDGIANIDSLVADTVDINAGTIDGATVGATSASTGKFTTLEASTSISGPVEGHSIDVIQKANLNINTDHTDTFVFPFVPSKIVLIWNYYGVKIITGEVGLSFGQSVITITGTDTMTVRTEVTHDLNGNGTDIRDYRTNDTTNVIFGQAGHDGVNQARVVGTGVWDTSSKTLTITYAEYYTVAAANKLSFIATAYR